jgi:hypothetical protein
MNNFERSDNPNKSLGVGYNGIIQSMNEWLIVTEKDLYQNVNHQYYSIDDIQLLNIRGRRNFQIFEATLVIVIYHGQFRILKNRYSIDNGIYPEDELPAMIFKLKRIHDTKWRS